MTTTTTLISPLSFPETLTAGRGPLDDPAHFHAKHPAVVVLGPTLKTLQPGNYVHLKPPGVGWWSWGGLGGSRLHAGDSWGTTKDDGLKAESNITTTGTRTLEDQELRPDQV